MHLTTSEWARADVVVSLCGAGAVCTLHTQGAPKKLLSVFWFIASLRITFSHCCNWTLTVMGKSDHWKKALKYLIMVKFGGFSKMRKQEFPVSNFAVEK